MPDEPDIELNFTTHVRRAEVFGPSTCGQIGRGPGVARHSMNFLRRAQSDRVFTATLSHELKPGAAIYLDRPHRDREGEESRSTFKLA